MLFVHLKQVRYHGYHGVHAEELVLGNDFEVNLTVGFELTHARVTELGHTIDYTSLEAIVHRRMQEPTQLLETLVTDITLQIRERFPQVREISISIHKLYPVLNNFEGSLGVSFEWKKDRS